MFCSNCGKTLKGDAATCPHCKAAVGDSRFDGHPYTGAQVRTRPGEAVRLPANHTKTTFMGSDPTMDGDVDARTTYRATIGAKVSGYHSEEEEREPLYDSQNPDMPEEEPVFGEHDAEENDAPSAPKARAKKRPGKRTANLDADSEKGSDEGLNEGFNEDFGGDAEDEPVKRPAKKHGKKKKRAAKTEEEIEAEEAEAELEEIRARDITLDNRKGISEDVRKYMQELHEEALAKEAEKSRRERAKPQAEKKERKKLDLKSIRFGFRRHEEDFDAIDSLDPDDQELVEDTDEFDLSDLPPMDENQGYETEEDDQQEVSEEEAYDDEAQEETGEEAGESFDPDDVDYGFEDELAYERRQKIKNILKYAIAGLVVVCVLVGAIVGISFIADKTKTSPIDGVSYDLHSEGIELMRYRVSGEYREDRLGRFDGSASSMIAFTESISKDLDGLKSLLPDAPSVNDNRFIAALTAIQTNINNCLTNDMLASTDTTLTAQEKQAASDERWKTVIDTVNVLANATNPAQLDGIVNGERIDVIAQTTPEPVQATPAPYATLAFGSKGAEVTELQTRLSALGYLNSEVDGDFGSKTKTAVQLFQKAVGLEITGVADAETQIALFDLNAPRYSSAS